MKTISCILSLIIANSAFAAISQPVTELNDPLIRVLGGNQRNGVTAIEQVFTNVTQGLGGQYQTARTISMHDSLPFAQGIGVKYQALIHELSELFRARRGALFRPQ
ncbi:hypothetical protein HQ393_17425 (plasmid) [Chitinibacter bivalviorum]|uniref:Uncharacterized protein n=1 Tax=Chitinibacter bivalviorum TaxID=2739434 RepID=A0A7H9BNN0_9NEIS|nr:hypothetical protein [Chitinibacter bivalviorum]QLG90092.1 hypothetical protein HQ393_17425 [Chitinibacter bivalviorum]